MEKYIVDGLNDRRRRTEGTGETALQILRRRIPGFLFLKFVIAADHPEQTGVAGTPLINGLLDVAHHEKGTVPSRAFVLDDLIGKIFQDGPLKICGILKLVQQIMIDLCVKPFFQDRAVCFGFSGDQQGNILKCELPCLPYRFRVSPVKGRHKIEQCLCAFDHIFKLASDQMQQHFCGDFHKIPRQNIIFSAVGKNGFRHILRIQQHIHGAEPLGKITVIKITGPAVDIIFCGSAEFIPFFQQTFLRGIGHIGDRTDQGITVRFQHFKFAGGKHKFVIVTVPDLGGIPPQIRFTGFPVERVICLEKIFHDPHQTAFFVAV